MRVLLSLAVLLGTLALPATAAAGTDLYGRRVALRGPSVRLFIRGR
jgi:hypothetical protein